MKDQLRLLKRLGAPHELIASFIEVCEINDSLPGNLKSSFAELLAEQCRKFGFHDILPDGWFFRPYSLGPGKRLDAAVIGTEPEAPAIEQAYRRGYAQGFSRCRALVEANSDIKDIRKEDQRITSWRVRNVQSFGSRPGSDERPPRKLFGGRASISNRLRWEVFQRDNFHCVKCGSGASHGATIEVDHIVAVAKGGFDTIDNLQTLCSRCNSGKSSS